MSEQEKDRIWLGLLDAERVSRYYMALSEKMTRCNQITTVVIVLCSTSVMAELIARAPQWLIVVTALALAAATIWLAYYDYAMKAAATAMTADRCREIGAKWRNLWYIRDNLDGSALPEIINLEKQMDQATSSGTIAYLGLTTHNRIHEKATEEAYAVIKEEFAQ